MGLAILKSRAQLGSDAPPVTIEVFLSGGLPAFSIVGMPATAVRESKDRVRGAILNSGFKFPQERITVSLGPADMKKTGGRFDLAIALGILAAGKQLPANSVVGIEFFGELALIDDRRRTSNATAISNCELITLSREAFQREVNGKPEQYRTLLRIATERLRQMEELVMLLAFAPNRERLEYALRLARQRTVPHPKHPEQSTYKGGPTDLAMSAAVDEDSARRFLDLATRKGALTYSQKQIRFLR